MRGLDSREVFVECFERELMGFDGLCGRRGDWRGCGMEVTCMDMDRIRAMRVTRSTWIAGCSWIES